MYVCVLAWPRVYPSFPFLFYLVSNAHQKLHGRLYTEHSAIARVYGGEQLCVGACVKSRRHTRIRKENKPCSVNLKSNPSITAGATWAPICLEPIWDHITFTMPGIWFDLHGRHQRPLLTSVRHPPPLSNCAWVATEPWAPLNPVIPGCGWYGDQTGHGESSDS